MYNKLLKGKEKMENNEYYPIKKAKSYKDAVEIESLHLPIIVYTELKERKYPCYVLKYIPEPELEKSEVFFPILIGLICLIIGILFLLGYIKNELLLPLVYGLVNLKSFDLLKTVILMKLGPYKQWARTHAAEHMIIIAYEKYKRIPTIKEIKSCSRFSMNCGTVNSIKIILIFIIIWVIGLFVNDLWLCTILQVLAFLFVDALMASGILKYFEIFVTNKPTHVEFVLILQCLKSYIKACKQLTKENQEILTDEEFESILL